MLPETFVTLICTFEKSCPCPLQAAGVTNAATATSIKLTSSFRMPILRALFRTSSVGILPLDLLQAYYERTKSPRACAWRCKHMKKSSQSRISPLAVIFALIIVLPFAAGAAQQPAQKPPPHDMDHMQHNHGGFMQQGMHHAVAKGIK